MVSCQVAGGDRGSPIPYSSPMDIRLVSPCLLDVASCMRHGETNRVAKGNDLWHGETNRIAKGDDRKVRVAHDERTEGGGAAPREQPCARLPADALGTGSGVVRMVGGAAAVAFESERKSDERTESGGAAPREQARRLRAHRQLQARGGRGCGKKPTGTTAARKVRRRQVNDRRGRQVDDR